MSLLQQACKRQLPVIFLPTHRSHFDYILITFLLFNYDIRAPHVAAGDNLLIPFFGSLMRGLGGFFIRRKLDRVAGQKDHIYRAVLYTYMEELLRNGEYLEFFLEGGRTRSGKPLPPKGGLLSVVVDSLQSGVIEDAYIVPVGISYDRLVDGNFVREQMGEPKVYETFWRAVVAIYRVLMGYYGIVRVDFSQPFSLREYVNVYKFYPDISQPSPSNSGTSLLMDNISTVSTGTAMASENNTAVTALIRQGTCESSFDVTTGENRALVHSLAEHVIYASTNCASMMSTHVLALLLLTSHRQGATLGELVVEFDRLKEEILCRERDVGFAGATIDVVFHAQQMLGDRLVRVIPTSDVAVLLDDKDQMNTVKLVPVTSLPDVFELSYYANVASTVFAVESVLANSIYSLVEADKWLTHHHGVHIKVSRNQLIERATELCNILKYEFIFSPPCRTLDLVLSDAVDKLRHSDVLVSVEQLEQADEDSDLTNVEERLWARRYASNLRCGFDDSDDETWDVPDETYVLSTNIDLLKKFWFLKHVLSPIIETYYITACRLTLLHQEDIPETEFIKSLHVLMKERIKNCFTSYAESAAIDTIRNAVHSFRSSGVVNRYEVAGVSMLSLSPAYRDETVLDGFIKRFETYRE
jgi:glycerol-3-phosphate O-acyltransferase 1/2